MLAATVLAAFGHDATQLRAGTFGAGNWIFPAWLGLGGVTPTEQLTVPGNASLNGTLYAVDGNVGIGTTSPNNMLEIESGTEAPGLRIESTSSSYNPVINLENDNNETTQIYVGRSSGSVSGDLVITASQSPTSRDIILNNAGGNVGIGTTSPQDDLHIYAATNPFIRIEDSQTDPGDFAIGLSSASGESYLDFFEMDGGGSKMVIRQSGNVGIGTTSPSGRLDVKGASSNPVYFRDDNNAVKYLFSGIGNGENAQMSLYNSSGAQRTRIASGTTDTFFLDDVGIGTTSPSAKLHVVGNAKVTGFVCGNRYHAPVTDASSSSDTGNEVATLMTSLETEGKTYTCIDCIYASGSAADCTSTSGGGRICEFKITC